MRKRSDQTGDVQDAQFADAIRPDVRQPIKSVRIQLCERMVPWHPAFVPRGEHKVIYLEVVLATRSVRGLVKYVSIDGPPSRRHWQPSDARRAMHTIRRTIVLPNWSVKSVAGAKLVLLLLGQAL